MNGISRRNALKRMSAVGLGLAVGATGTGVAEPDKEIPYDDFERPYPDKTTTRFGSSLRGVTSHPEMLARCDPTQLYVSVDAPDRGTFDSTVKAVEDDAWDSLVDTLDVLAEKEDTRTVIRSTLVRDHNMHHPEWYAAMCDRADADFVELKAYMHVGHSRGRLDRESMPSHEEILDFTESMQEFLPDHDTIKEVEPSRVAMLARDSDTWVPKLNKDNEFWESDPLVEY